MICSRHLSSGVDIVLLKILVSAITEQAVHIVCDYLTYTDIAPLSYFWSSFFVGNAGPLTNVGSRGPCPSPSFSGSTLPGWYPVNLLLCHSPNYFRMSALSESRWGPCSSYFDFLINTDRIFFSTRRYWEWSTRDMIWGWNKRDPSWGRISIDTS